MQNKLDLFQIIEEVVGGGDLKFQNMLDTEIVKYTETFHEELDRVSKEINVRL